MRQVKSKMTESTNQMRKNVRGSKEQNLLKITCANQSTKI